MQKIFYGLVDSGFGTKDYLDEQTCVRFVVIVPEQFTSLTEGKMPSQGLDTYVVDVDYVEFFARYLSDEIRVDDSPSCSESADTDLVDIFRDESIHKITTWFRIVVTEMKSGSSYFYKTFSETPPTFVKILGISVVNGPLPTSLPPFRGQSDDKAPAPVRRAGGNRHEGGHNIYRFSAFHVGQGMCSLVHNNEAGFLLDAGAGKPVTRRLYLSGKLRNDLRDIIKKMGSLALVLSHADSDHWRIIDWDPAILRRIEIVYVPKGAMSFAFYDRAIYAKVTEIHCNLKLKLAARTTLSILRSIPKKNDSNGNCLVSVFTRGSKKALAPGDYVYKRYSTDGNKGINRLHNSRYTAVIVPHHGDESSALKIVRPARDGIAFFSAGTHETYKHPTGPSLHAHIVADYNIIVNNALRDIKMLRMF